MDKIRLIYRYLYILDFNTVFKTNLQKKQLVTILLIVSLVLFMLFTYVLAQYLSERTEQEDVSAVTPTEIEEDVPEKYFTQTMLSADQTDFYVRTCPASESSATDNVDYTKCTSWTKYPVTSLNGTTTNFGASGLTVKSLNMYSYMQGTNSPAEKVKQVVHADLNGTDYVYSRTCGIKTDKSLDCTSSTAWVRVELKDFLDDKAVIENVRVTKADSINVTVINVTDGTTTKQVYQRLALLEGGKQWTGKRCDLNSTGTVTTTCYPADQSWNLVELDDALKATIAEQTGSTAPSQLLSNDIYQQSYKNVSSIKQTYLDLNGKDLYYRICPVVNTGANNTASFNCGTTPTDEKKWTKGSLTDLAFTPEESISNIDSFVSSAYSLSLAMAPTPSTTTVPNETPGATNPVHTPLACSKVYDSEELVLDGNVIYTITLDDTAPGPDGTVIVSDRINSKLEIIEHPLYCDVVEQEVMSSVLGVSDFYTERGSLLFTIILFSLLAGGVAYVIVVRNRNEIQWKLVADKPYLAALLAMSAVLAIGAIYFLSDQADVSPGDVPAATLSDVLVCNVPEGVEEFTYTAKIVGAKSGDLISNTAQVNTGTNTTINECSTEFIVGESDPTTTPQVSDTPIPEPSDTGMPATPAPTFHPEAIFCGPSDLENDGVLDIWDFGGVGVGFAQKYQKYCNDTPAQRAEYNECGAKDINNDNQIEFNDFISFARRYGIIIGTNEDGTKVYRQCDLNLYTDN